MPASDFTPEWIWGDDAETTVYAQGYGAGRTVIFSFVLNESKPSTSLANRICKCLHDPESEAFPNPEEMRKVLWTAVHSVWPQCLDALEMARLDAIVKIEGDDVPEKITWTIYHHPLFQRFIDYLGDENLGQTPISPEMHVVQYRGLTRFEQLGGRGCATRVQYGSDARTAVFKGIDFRTFLTYSDDEGDRTIKHMIRGWHNSNRILSHIPPHPNVLPPPTTLVTMTFPEDTEGRTVVCGTLQPLYRGGNVGDVIEKTNSKGERLSLEWKAHWCRDMAAAVAHIHRVAKTYHMDIKPGNFVITDQADLILIDWEQTDAPASTLAPEADGTWDVYEKAEQNIESDNPGGGGKPRLIYSKYYGPERRNVDENVLGDYTWNVWNVFPVWHLNNPRALELAEVFALGRCMWMLLRQPDMDFDEIEHPNDLVTDWEGANDIPEDWKKHVDHCLSADPNDRPDIIQVANFWDDIWTALGPNSRDDQQQVSSS